MYKPPVSDYEFLFRNVIDIEELLSSFTSGTVSLDDAIDILKGSGDVVAPIAALNRKGDRDGVRMKDGTVVTPDGFREAFDTYVEGGWIGLAVPAELGGAGLPRTISTAADEFLSGANMAFSLSSGLTAAALAVFASVNDPELNETYVSKMITGQWTGTMDLTEPQAGTDLASIRTVAKPRDDGSYELNGQKIFISWGDHDLAENIVHLVLARTPGAPEGIGGLSLFIVPKYLPDSDGEPGQFNEMVCVSLEHKLGIHASPTCVIEYGGSTGFLVGELHKGLATMFVMMNAARMGTGVQALAVAENAYQMAVEYSRERVQGPVWGRDPGSPIAEHPDVRRLLLSMRSALSAMRAFAAQTAAWLDTSNSERSERGKEASYLSQMFLPVVKGWLTETGVQVASDAIQVHGGMGYIEETGVAQHLRDVRILPIYEGTTAVQANHLVGRMLLKDRGSTAELACDLIDATVRELREVKDPAGARVATRLESATAIMRETTGRLVHETDEPRDAFAVAVPYLNMWGILAGGWMHGRMLESAAETDEPDRVLEAEFFSIHFLSQLAGLSEVVAAGEVALDTDLAMSA